MPKLVELCYGVVRYPQAEVSHNIPFHNWDDHDEIPSLKKVAIELESDFADCLLRIRQMPHLQIPLSDLAFPVRIRSVCNVVVHQIDHVIAAVEFLQELLDKC